MHVRPQLLRRGGRSPSLRGRRASRTASAPLAGVVQSPGMATKLATSQGAATLPLWGTALAGGAAGCVEGVVTMPFEVAKNRMQLHGHQGGVGGGMLAALRTTIATNGVRGLYYGLPATLVQASGKLGIRFTAFESCVPLAIAVAFGRDSHAQEPIKPWRPPLRSWLTF